MDIDRLETHDRLLEFQKQAATIDDCCKKLIDAKPFGNHPFYIFAHTRTLDLQERYKLWLTGKYKSVEEAPTSKLIWQPRLTKPKAQTNSMLFKGYPGSDRIDVIWIIPDRSLWGQYEDGLISENNLVKKSIHDFQFDRKKLERKDESDLTDEQIDAIYRDLSKEGRRKRAMQETLEASQNSLKL